jgi:hypothetical protein
MPTVPGAALRYQMPELSDVSIATVRDTVARPRAANFLNFASGARLTSYVASSQPYDGQGGQGGA